jgi:hypothetical protein
VDFTDAYDALSNNMKNHLAGLTAVHDFAALTDRPE